jgi:hypothetical protein
VSAYGLLGGHISQQSLTVATGPGDFVIASARVDETTYGFVGALGLRWDVTDDLHLGASLFTPALGWGTRRYFAAAAVAGAGSATGAPNSAIVNEDALHASPTQPLRVQGGVAWSHGPLTLSGDVIWLAPREVLDDGDRAAQGLERHIVRNGVVNFAVGAEWIVDGRFPLRAGFFTDLAASPEPVATPAAGGGSDILNTGHVNRLGGTFSVGYLSEHTSSALGVNVSGGSGTDLVPDNLDFSRFKPTRSTQLLVYVFLATAYQF